MATVTAERTTAAADSATNIEVPIRQVRPSPLNPRRHFGESALEELAESIKAVGLLEPIVVRLIASLAAPADGIFYEIIGGERRYRACQLAGLEWIPVRVLGDTTSIDDAKAIELMLVENLQRQDLDAIEEAEAYAALNRVVGLKQREIAAAVKRSQPVIANRMRLLTLPEDVRERIRSGELSPAHGIALARFSEFPTVASKLAELAAAGNWRAKELEDGLPHPWELQRTGAVRMMGYLTHFDTTVCHACPFNAYRKNPSGMDGGMDGGFCLNPAHYDELEAAAIAAKAAAVQEQVAAAEASGAPTLRTSDMRYDEYERIYPHTQVPAGCDEHCPCRAQALGYDGEPCLVCLDPKGYQRLQAAETKAKKAAAKSDVKDRLALLTRRIDGAADVGTDELRILAVAALAMISRPKCIKAAAERHLPELAGVNWGSWTSHSGEWPRLTEVDADALVKMALEALLRDEMARKLGFEGTATPWSDWYLEQGTSLMAVLGTEAAE